MRPRWERTTVPGLAPCLCSAVADPIDNLVKLAFLFRLLGVLASGGLRRGRAANPLNLHG